MECALVAWLLVVLGAAAHAGLIAVGRVEGGDVPGEGAPGQEEVTLLAVAVLLAGGLLLGLAGLADSPSLHAPGARLLPLMPVAAVLFLVARWLSFDPYYAPTRRRFADGGAVPAELVVGFVCVAAVVPMALLIGRSRRPAAIAGGGLLLAVAFAAIIAGGGH